ncbi:hypothetical protein MACK_004072 [Theileria orientalis]|uniref:Uncharacterized protein n=1 Tax=Theileria orientalis TaxID=68886 RepID=A0A976SJW0_THEOR|nr:hypothetical protein MACK_004072 [Theileria orientalis]
MRFLTLFKQVLPSGRNTLIKNSLPGSSFGYPRIPSKMRFSTLNSESIETAELKNKFKGSEEQQSKKLMNYKSEATCTRKVYADNDKVSLGPPTFTIFSPEVCLTLKLKKDELTGLDSLLLTGMTRLKDGSNSFNKNSRISSVLPLDTLKKLNEVLKRNSERPVTFEGLDGCSVEVTNSNGNFSLKLYPTLVPGLNLTSGMLPGFPNGSSHLNFTGSVTEHSLLVHALSELSESL